MIEAIVAALMSNGTATAQQILAQLVAGTQETVDPDLSATAASRRCCSALGKPTKTCCSASSRFRTDRHRNPQSDRSKQAASGGVGMGQGVGIRSVSASAGEFADRADTPPAAYDQIWTALSEAHVENLPAQIAMYRSDRLPDRRKSRSNASLRSKVGGSCVGCWAAFRRNSLSPLRMELTRWRAHRRLAELLWGQASRSWSKCGSAPQKERSKVRGYCRWPRPFPAPPCATVLQSMEQYWDEGPKRVEALGRLRGIAARAGLSPSGKAIALGRTPPQHRQIAPPLTAAAPRDCRQLNPPK